MERRKKARLAMKSDIERRTKARLARKRAAKKARRAMEAVAVAIGQLGHHRTGHRRTRTPTRLVNGTHTTAKH